MALLLDDLVQPVVATVVGEGVKLDTRGWTAAEHASLKSTLTELEAVGIGKCESRNGKIELDQSRRVRDLDDSRDWSKCAEDRGNDFGVREEEGVLLLELDMLANLTRFSTMMEHSV